jgi:carbamoyltransferase
MTQTFKCKKDFIKKHPAVVHVDGTARPQVISKKTNTIYYNVVKSYCKLTGEKALINTSFNQHEEPIVCKPIDAIRSLLKGNIDILAIGSFLVKKNKNVKKLYI